MDRVRDRGEFLAHVPEKWEPVFGKDRANIYMTGNTFGSPARNDAFERMG